MSFPSKEKEASLTQSALKEMLSYDPKTGLFRWLSTRSGIKADGAAGYINPKTNYCVITVKNNTFKAHRLAWLYVYGEWPINDIDHINQNGSDNRIENLRDVNRIENGRNHSLSRTNTSGITGVCWNTRTKIWHANIRIGSRNIHLGTYHDKFEAVCARKSANNKHGFSPDHGKPKIK